MISACNPTLIMIIAAIVNFGRVQRGKGWPLSSLHPHPDPNVVTNSLPTFPLAIIYILSRADIGTYQFRSDPLQHVQYVAIISSLANGHTVRVSFTPSEQAQIGTSYRVNSCYKPILYDGVLLVFRKNQ